MPKFSSSNPISPHRTYGSIVRTAAVVLLSLCSLYAIAGEKLLIQLRDFTKTEVKSGGFTIPSSERIHVEALGGGGEKNIMSSATQMYAYGWIINAETREPVWVMSRDNTLRQKDDRSFDGEVSLPKGSYEVYFAAYAFSSSSGFSMFNINVDHRKDDFFGSEEKPKGFFSWLDQLFGGDMRSEWRRRAKHWGIDVSVNEEPNNVSTFGPPKEFQNVLYQAVRLGENERVKQAFTVARTVPIRIYALGEFDGTGNPVDYGWIADAKSYKRVWEMKRTNTRSAGGAEKNIKSDDVVSFEPGEYILYYNTDDSHSYVDWNAAPPSDPFHYGISLIGQRSDAASSFKLTEIKKNPNTIVDITKMGNSQTRTVNFTLKKDEQVHVYALGERSNTRHQMADYGWIIDTRTREKIWTMDAGRTEPAGGAEKNRMVDEVITLSKGTYTVFYQTDDSHAYNDWNAAPPFDQEHWGITISGVGDQFDMHDVEENVSAKQPGVIAQIVRVGDNADATESFRIEKPTRIRIYAIGEGQNREMYDYGWIENAHTGSVIWEMTYSMTFHAGGGRKNRLVNTSLLIDKGEYKLRYKSDDSHSFNDWNTDPPDDPTMWGITLYEEK
jgi:hypothetical protein